jgi:Uma2 family endonuclease
VQDYHRLVEMGFWGENERIELIRGELIQMAVKGTAHETCITRLMRVLFPLVAEQVTLRCQSPISLADSEPEPDVTIVGIADYWLFNLFEGYLEAYSQPTELRPGQFGYLHRNIVPATASIALPPFPEQVVNLSQIFPPQT